MKHFLTLKDYTKDELLEILEIAKAIKAEVKAGEFRPRLQNKCLAMIFEKSSTRTRVSFEIGMRQLGGHALFLSSRDIQLGRGEPVKDTARTIGRMADMIMGRVYKQSDLEQLAEYSGVPVINGLSDDFHPVQLMADYMTMMEHGKAGGKVAFIGDGNNVCHSWLMLASVMGFEISVANPRGFEPNAKVIERAIENSVISGAKINLLNDPESAIKGADVVATDTWISMGMEEEKERRIKAFAGYCIDEAMMKLANKGAMFLHCLPAYRGYEMSESVFEAHAGEIFDEAENRLHAQKGIMVWLDSKRGA